MTTKTLNVVMIATNESTNIVLNTINNRLLLDNDKTLVERILPIHGKHQHLYFTSEDEIQDLDNFGITIPLLFINDNNSIKVITYSNKRIGDYYEIEATTNKSLQVNCDGKCAKYEGICSFPQIPQSFIEAYIKAYNEGNPILTVDVETEEYDTIVKDFKDIRIKTNSANEVIIVEPKLYTKGDLVNFGNDVYSKFTKNISMNDFVNNWIENNL